MPPLLTGRPVQSLSIAVRLDGKLGHYYRYKPAAFVVVQLSNKIVTS
jgi:hypothetical protein